MQHGILDSSYDEQLLSSISNSPLSELLDYLNGQTQYYLLPNSKIYKTISYNTMAAFSTEVGSHLDGVVTQLKAEECRRAYDILMDCYPNIPELQSIYEHLREYFKTSRNPMALKN